jgi:hypothetical protein
VGPRGFVVKAPVEFDSMGPHWVSRLGSVTGERRRNIFSLAEVGELGNRTVLFVAWETPSVYYMVTATSPPLDVKKSFSARTARPGSLFSRSKSIPYLLGYLGCYYRVDPVGRCWTWQITGQ